MKLQVDTSHPFYAFTVSFAGGPPVALCHTDVDSRLAKVKGFDATTCERALALPDLQKTVRTAIERRLRKLTKAEQA